MDITIEGSILRLLTPLQHKMDRPWVAYFSQEELVIILESYEEYRKHITANTVSVCEKKTRKECWQKIANHLYL